MDCSKEIEIKVGMMKNSTNRLEVGLKLPNSKEALQFIKREAWLHLKRSFELCLLLVGGNLIFRN